MAACPRCAEEIPPEFAGCPRCALAGGPVQPAQPAQPPSSAPWYFRGGSLFVAFLVVGPLVLPLVWAHPTLSRTRKKVYTGLVIGITTALMVGSAAGLYWLNAKLAELGVL